MNIIKIVKPFLIKYSPEILTGLGIASYVLSVYETGKASCNIKSRIERKKEILEKEKLTFKETLSVTWKDYIPAALTLISGTICIISGATLYSKRNALVTAALTMTEAAYEEYKQATKEVIGEEKEKKIEHSISEKKVEQALNNNLIITGDGDFEFLDSWSGRLFKSNWNKIEKASNYLNSNAISGNDIITLNDWYSVIGLDTLPEGDKFGWTVYNGSSNLLYPVIDSCIYNDRPIGCIRYKKDPKLL